MRQQDISGREPTAKVTFAPAAGALFVAEVKERVAEYFRSRRLATEANGSMMVKGALLLGVTIGCYLLILSNQFSPWTMLGLSILMGIGVAGIGFGIAHDALHGAYSRHAWVNRLLSLSFELTGANGYMWRITHNVIHHTYPNVHGLDEDLEVSPLLRLSPESRHRPIHRYQHFYALAAYSLTTLFWVFVKDYKYFLKRDLGPFLGRRHPAGEVTFLIAAKLVYYTYTIVIPLLVLDVAWWQFLVGFLAMHATAGSVLGVVFQLAHVVEETEHPAPDEDGMMDSAWMVHQMMTTSNFATSNRLLTWYVGGLNHQVEHHLFPKICSVHYPALSPIVRSVAEKHGVVYRHHETLRAAIASHFGALKHFGRPVTV